MAKVHNFSENLLSLEKKVMIYGYIRVSSDKQTVENQRFEINNFCKKEKLIINGWIEETISGTKSYNKRELGKLLKSVQKGDLIICAELSRLGRNLFKVQRSSRAREFHPHPLTEPCVKVSPHTALHTQLFVHRHNLGV